MIREILTGKTLPVTVPWDSPKAEIKVIPIQVYFDFRYRFSKKVQK